MKFIEVKLRDAYIIELEPIEDQRGFFARTFCREEFRKNGIDFNIVQCNISYNKKKGTIRGMHYQDFPYPEAKIVTCIKGKIYDVIIDLRSHSPTFGKWIGVELDEKSFRMLYVPKFFAHGFQTLEDDTIVFYQMSEFYHPECARGIRWDDPFFNIKWPIKNPILSEKDRKWQLFKT